MIPYTLVRSRRKTVAIYVTKDATVEVRAPLSMPKSSIDSFVQAKSQWISSHQASIKNRLAEKAAFTLNYGDMLTLCGKTYPVLEKDTDASGFDGEAFRVPPGLASDEIKKAAVQIYKSAAKHLLTHKTAAFAEQMGVTPSAVKINSAKSRWGSCSGKNSINFSWRLIMADEGVIDYIVVHELAHIRELNHSPRFWAIVQDMLPDYKARKQRLKALQDKLSREDWN
ncbi:MAG: M48 family metallopeptidase [Oscillospiraceae bacterium]|nr:M48 family metallopeptidase [Oscillospiraceae bacterium]